MKVMKVRHPAKFSDAVLALLDAIIPPGCYLDPFAGPRSIHELANPQRSTWGVEIEPEWCVHERTVLGNALALGDVDVVQVVVGEYGGFNGIVTSPCYGNRFADHHNAVDTSERRSYTHDLRTMTGDPKRKLHPDNSGTLHFGPAYIDFHRRVWAECAAVLLPRGLIFLNVSDFIRRKKRVPVVATHRGLLKRAGFELIAQHEVETPRMRYGENRDARVECEVVIVGRKKS